MNTRLHGADDAFEKLSAQVDAMMDELMGNNIYRLVSSDAWEPQINIYEANDRFWICVELAGMPADRIDVYANDKNVKITGTRVKPEPPAATGTMSVHVMEIDSGRFERTVKLPLSVDSNGVTANYRNGFLWVSLLKSPDKQGAL